jgi:hypothetical protein
LVAAGSGGFSEISAEVSEVSLHKYFGLSKFAPVFFEYILNKNEANTQ